MKFPTVYDITIFHNKSLEKFGGKRGVRDQNLLEFAVNQIHQKVFGTKLYPTDFEKIARLGYSLIRNHPFIDGNKRTGFATMLVTLKYNQYIIHNEKIAKSQNFIEQIAAGEKGFEDIIIWLQTIASINPPLRNS